MSFTKTESGLLYALQRGLPLTPRPFASLGNEWGFSERETLAFVARLFADGAARRLGGVFNSRRLGYKSVLCAVELPNEAWTEAVATVVVPHPAVTHCVARAWPQELDDGAAGSPQGRPAPTLWFTCSAPARQLEAILREMRERINPAELLVMQPQTCYKFDAPIDPEAEWRADSHRADPEPPEPLRYADSPMTYLEQEGVRLLQGNLAPVAEFYQPIATALDMPVEMLLELMQTWRKRGILRRVGLLLRHEHLGYRAHGLGVWYLPVDRIESAARHLAALPDVTHCYARHFSLAWPYNVTAMFHGRDWESLHTAFAAFSEQECLINGRLLGTRQEFKRSAVRYFEDRHPFAYPAVAVESPALKP